MVSGSATRSCTAAVLLSLKLPGVQGQGLSSAWSLNFTRLMNSWSVALRILSTVWPPAANPPSSWLLWCSRRAAASTTAGLWCPPLVASCSPGFCSGSVLLQPGQQLWGWVGEMGWFILGGVGAVGGPQCQKGQVTSSSRSKGLGVEGTCKTEKLPPRKSLGVEIVIKKCYRVLLLTPTCEEGKPVCLQSCAGCLPRGAGDGGSALEAWPSVSFR